jgi:hypothetical protein
MKNPERLSLVVFFGMIVFTHDGCSHKDKKVDHYTLFF